MIVTRRLRRQARCRLKPAAARRISPTEVVWARPGFMFGACRRRGEDASGTVVPTAGSGFCREADIDADGGGRRSGRFHRCRPCLLATAHLNHSVRVLGHWRVHPRQWYRTITDRKLSTPPKCRLCSSVRVPSSRLRQNEAGPVRTAAGEQPEKSRQRVRHEAVVAAAARQSLFQGQASSGLRRHSGTAVSSGELARNNSSIAGRVREKR